jgi:hypothetical protein
MAKWNSAKTNAKRSLIAYHAHKPNIIVLCKTNIGKSLRVANFRGVDAASLKQLQLSTYPATRHRGELPQLGRLRSIPTDDCSPTEPELQVVHQLGTQLDFHSCIHRLAIGRFQLSKL